MVLPWLISSCTKEVSTAESVQWIYDIPYQTDSKIAFDDAGNAWISTQTSLSILGIEQSVIHRILKVNVSNGQLDTVYSRKDSSNTLIHHWVKKNGKLFLVKCLLGAPGSTTKDFTDLSIWEVSAPNLVQKVSGLIVPSSGWVLSDVTPINNGFWANFSHIIEIDPSDQTERFTPTSHTVRLSNNGIIVFQRKASPSDWLTGYQVCVSSVNLPNRPFPLGLITGISDSTQSRIGLFPSWSIIPLDSFAIKQIRVVTQPEGNPVQDVIELISRNGFIRHFPSGNTILTAFIRKFSQFQFVLELNWFTPELNERKTLPIPGIENIFQIKAYNDNFLILGTNGAGTAVLISVKENGSLNWQTEIRTNFRNYFTSSLEGSTIGDFDISETNKTGFLSNIFIFDNSLNNKAILALYRFDPETGRIFAAP